MLVAQAEFSAKFDGNPAKLQTSDTQTQFSRQLASVDRKPGLRVPDMGYEAEAVVAGGILLRRQLREAVGSWTGT